MTEPDPVLTLHDVAEELGRCYHTVLRYVRTPEESGLHGTKQVGRWYVRRSALDAFLDADPARVA